MPKRKSKKYKIMVMNDSVNSFQHVQVCLQEICGHNQYQAIQCTNIIHNKGKCQVYMNTKDQCINIVKELETQGILAKIEK